MKIRVHHEAVAQKIATTRRTSKNINWDLNNSLKINYHITVAHKIYAHNKLPSGNFWPKMCRVCRILHHPKPPTVFDTN